MRGKIMAVLTLGLALTAGQAVAQQSDLLPRTELRNNLRHLHETLRDDFDSRAFASRMRIQALTSARAARVGAMAAERARRNVDRAMERMDRVRPMVRVRPFRMPAMREHIRMRRFRDI